MRKPAASDVAEQIVAAFPTHLKQLRETAHLTQEQLADLAEVSTRAVSRYETGEAIPDLRILCKLAWALEVDLAKLVPSDRS